MFIYVFIHFDVFDFFIIFKIGKTGMIVDAYENHPLIHAKRWFVIQTIKTKLKLNFSSNKCNLPILMGYLCILAF